MINEYEQFLEEGLRIVSREALERGDHESREPLIRTLAHINFLEEILDWDELRLLPHLLKTRGTSLRFYPRTLQRFCAWIKGAESPHFAIRYQSYEVQKVVPEYPKIGIWKRKQVGGSVYIPATSEVIIELNRLGYHNDLVNYFGNKELREVSTLFYDEVTKLMSMPNRYASAQSQIA